MPNIAALLKTEIVRLSKKAVREGVSPLQTASASHRHQIAALKRQLQDLQREVSALRKQIGRTAPSLPAKEADGEPHRFSVKGLRSLRARLGLSAEDFGRLIGVTGQSVYKWEAEKSLPRKAQISAIAALRGLGKKEARNRLESLKGTGA